MKNILSWKTNFRFFLEKNAFLTKNHHFLKFSQNSIVTLRYTGLLKKQQFCEKLIYKTMVKVSLYLQGQSSHVSAMANFKGAHTPMHVCRAA